jgi:choline transport protein
MAILGNIFLQIYSLNQDQDFVPQAWHVFIIYIIVSWIDTLFLIFGNGLLPILNTIGFFFILAGVLITIVVCAVIPGTNSHPPHANSEFVWYTWSADLGYESAGFIFVMGMLNGAYAVGTPDCLSHIAEEIPQPERNIPKAIAAQMSVGFLTGLCYLVAIFYAISDLDAVYESGGTFPLAQVYLQATSSTAGATGLLVLILIPLLIASVGVQLTASRTLWTLARDKATPFPNTLARVSSRWRNPVFAQLMTGILITVLGCIYVGSETAFNALIGSFVILSTASYVAALLPNLLNRRQHVQPGPFHIKGIWGDICLAISCAYIIVFIVIFCFPYSLPVSAQSMNVSPLRMIIHGTASNYLSSIHQLFLVV